MASTEAQKEASRKWYQANRDRQLLIRKEYYEKNKNKFRKWSKAWKDANREKVREWGRRDWKKYYCPERTAEWRKKNPEYAKQLARDNYHKNGGKILSAIKTGRRRTAMCEWASKDKIANIYLQASRLSEISGIPYVVDHIVPIKHKLVCGLHNEFNLRVITRKENAVKKNKFEVIV